MKYNFSSLPSSAPNDSLLVFFVSLSKWIESTAHSLATLGFYAISISYEPDSCHRDPCLVSVCLVPWPILLSANETIFCIECYFQWNNNFRYFIDFIKDNLFKITPRWFSRWTAEVDDWLCTCVGAETFYRQDIDCQWIYVMWSLSHWMNLIYSLSLQSTCFHSTFVCLLVVDWVALRGNQLNS